jgi:hypothetical protein
MAKPGRLQTKIWRMRTACWIPKATNARSPYAIVIRFPQQQWLRDLTSMLRYTYTLPVWFGLKFLPKISPIHAFELNTSCHLYHNFIDIYFVLACLNVHFIIMRVDTKIICTHNVRCYKTVIIIRYNAHRKVYGEHFSEGLS